MDIVFLTDHLARGGADTQLARLAITLKRRGWEVGVITMLPSEAFLDDLGNAGVPVFECSNRMPWLLGLPILMTFRMILQLIRWRPAALVTFNYHGDIMGRVCGRIAGIKTIISSLRTAHLKTPFRGKMYHQTERLIDLTISNSHAAIAYMVSRRVLSPAKTMVIPNGIVVSSFPHPATREEARGEFAFSSNDFVWLAVGNLTPAKDYSTLLEAAGYCATSFPEFHLLVAGAGAEQESLLAEVSRRGLTGKVHFLGSRTDVPRLLRACDAYVLSSAWEGMPNTVMEAMASGLPVVSTAAGGVRELLEPGVCGYIVPVRNPVALSERMIQVMAMDEHKRFQMGASGRERVARNFDLEHVVNRWDVAIRQSIRASANSWPNPGKVAPREPIMMSSPVPGVKVPPPGFIISMDFELMWGVRDKRTIQTYGDRVLGEREAIPAILEIFKRHEVKATWAAVGMALFDRKQDLLAHLPDLRPTYERTRFNPYLFLSEIGENERQDPYHFGASLVRKILDCEGMELGSHTFSHYYCLEKGQNSAQFKADLEASIAVSNRFSIRPTGFVFPRNQYNFEYLSVCSDLGFKAFRGNEPSWVYEATQDENQSSFKRAVRLADHYLNLTGDHGFIPRRFLDFDIVNCPSSRFLRPFLPELSRLEGMRILRIQRAMESAARKGQCFHLWWHPYNFGTHLRENMSILEALLHHHVVLRDRYGVVPMTMSEASQHTLSVEGIS